MVIISNGAAYRNVIKCITLYHLISACLIYHGVKAKCYAMDSGHFAAHTSGMTWAVLRVIPL